MSATASEGCVYLFRSRTTGLYKIGMSVNPENRIKQVEAEIKGMGWELVAEIKSSDQRSLERAFHAAFGHKRAGRKEWFSLSPVEVELFKELAKGTRSTEPERLVIDPATLAHLPRQALEEISEIVLDYELDMVVGFDRRVALDAFGAKLKRLLGPRSVFVVGST